MSQIVGLSRLGDEPVPDESVRLYECLWQVGPGVIGRRLVPQLVARGHQVTATTMSVARLRLLEQLGADGVVIDGARCGVGQEAVAAARTDAIVHEMTALSQKHNGKPNFRHPEQLAATTAWLTHRGNRPPAGRRGAASVCTSCWASPPGPKVSMVDG